MGNSKKGTAVEEKVVFTGNQQDFEQFRTWFHDHSSSSRVSRAEGEREEWLRGFSRLLASAIIHCHVHAGTLVVSGICQTKNRVLL